jgi:hypothetical protein
LSLPPADFAHNWPEVVTAVATAVSVIFAAVAALSSLNAISQAKRSREDEIQFRESERRARLLTLRHEYYRALVVDITIQSVDDFRRESIALLEEGTFTLGQLKASNPQHAELDDLLNRLTDGFNHKFYALAGTVRASSETWRDTSLTKGTERALESLQDEVTNTLDVLSRNPERGDFRAIIRKHTAALLKVIMEHDPVFKEVE